MDHTVRHELDMAIAKRVAEQAWQAYAEKYSKYEPTIDWVSETSAKIGFNAKGLILEGSIELREHAIDLTLDVPFFLKPFKQKAISVIETEIQKWVAKAKVGAV